MGGVSSAVLLLWLRGVESSDYCPAKVVRAKLPATFGFSPVGDPANVRIRRRSYLYLPYRYERKTRCGRAARGGCPRGRLYCLGRVSGERGLVVKVLCGYQDNVGRYLQGEPRVVLYQVGFPILGGGSFVYR